MLRFLCFALLVLTTFPLFAQEEPIMPEQRPMPRGNQAMLQRMRQQLTQDLQQLQRMMRAVRPEDTQFTTLLQAQQDELTKQLKDVTQQLEGFDTPAEELLPMTAANPPVKPAAPTIQEPDMPTTPGLPVPNRFPLTSPQPGIYPPNAGLGGLSGGALGGVMPGGIVPDEPPFPGEPSLVPNPWEPQPSKELIELKRTVESLRTEITDLKEIVKSLEAQIRLLNQNILLNNKTNE